MPAKRGPVAKVEIVFQWEDRIVTSSLMKSTGKLANFTLL